MTMTNETFTQQNAEYSQLGDIEDVRYVQNFGKFTSMFKPIQTSKYQGLARPSLMLGLLFIGENLTPKDIGVENCS